MAVTESSVLLSVAYKLRISSLSWRLLPCYSKDLEIMSGTELEEPGQLKRAVIDASAGAVAGAISRMVTSPLDVIKIRFQVQLEPTASWALTKKDSPLKPKYNDQLL